jgi:hypothetical protein
VNLTNFSSALAALPVYPSLGAEGTDIYLDIDD